MRHPSVCYLASTKINDEDVAFTVGLLVKTVSDSGSSSEPIDNTYEGLHSRNGTCVLRSLSWELLKYAGTITTEPLNLRPMRCLASKSLREHGNLGREIRLSVVL
jgi:hypothetical protein